MFLLAPILSFLKLIPWWVYVLAAILAWGGYQKALATHRATELATQAQKVAQSREKALADALVESSRRAAAQTKVVRDAEQSKIVAVGAAASAAAAADSLRQQLESDRSARAANDPGFAIAGSAASSPIGMLAIVLGQCVSRVQVLAEYADISRISGKACVQAYNSLSVK